MRKKIQIFILRKTLKFDLGLDEIFTTFIKKKY